jgi:hypothetical protein
VSARTLDPKKVPMPEIISAYGPGPGRHWFDYATRRFFRTKLPTHGLLGENGFVYFVTGETDPGNTTRYSIRALRGPGNIQTIGEFHSYPTRRSAQSAAVRLSKGGVA